MKSLFLFFFIISSTLFAVDPVEFQVGGFSFSRPSSWGWVVPTSSMRKAQLEVSGANQSKADVTFFHFGPGQGGGVKANVDRWFGQFQNAKTAQNEVDLGGVRVVFVLECVCCFVLECVLFVFLECVLFYSLSVCCFLSWSVCCFLPGVCVVFFLECVLFSFLECVLFFP